MEGRCPVCGSSTRLRTSKKDGNKYYVCVNYPECIGKVAFVDEFEDVPNKETVSTKSEEQPKNREEKPSQSKNPTGLIAVIIAVVAIVAGIAILGIVLSGDNESGTTCLSCEEAISLAQGEWNDAVQQIPCTDGRTYMVNHMSSYHWTCDYQYEPDYILVKYVPAGSARHIDSNVFYAINLNNIGVGYKWRVYCDTHIVTADGDTWNKLQTAITNLTAYYCD